ncbi:putative secreted protein with PEP-CTERM sorting signal [Nitrosomonas nitrosa]|uniref:PEP-CTERM sorting domain-containing protein n=1 Tax=Nitrosomonas nitrosa TaxID=52442 RepID=UPI000D4077BB|nr:PEP-CTERM sorting domain-containing protein [Nitrosomonas nitrosa]PTQ92500.1 putative secreted protein with PEP-CTERM sorting signal [Nitrosomonas nitrosa]
MKKSNMLASLLAAMGIAIVTPASAVVIGGINFGALGGDPSRIHLETATLAQQIVTGDGQSSLAYGVISTVNGSSNYCGAAGDSSCSLYYVANFTGSQNFSSGYVEFTGATVDLYYSNQPQVNLLTFDNSPNNIDFIDDLTPWVSFTGHAGLGDPASANAVLNAFGTFAGASLSFLGSGLLDVVGGSGLPGVADFLNANTIADSLGGFADVAITSSANNLILNPNDISAGLTGSCGSATPQSGDWCFQGTANIRGNTEIPEPSIIALLGIGLIGLTFASRRQRFYQ